MSLIGLCSAHGSPGVTSTAVALVATWPEDRRCLLVEADPFGGVIGSRYGLSDTPGCRRWRQSPGVASTNKLSGATSRNCPVAWPCWSAPHRLTKPMPCCET